MLSKTARGHASKVTLYDPLLTVHQQFKIITYLRLLLLDICPSLKMVQFNSYKDQSVLQKGTLLPHYIFNLETSVKL